MDPPSPEGWRTLGDAVGLVVDDSTVARTVLVSELKEIGVGTVVACSRASDARVQLASRRFDIVLCDYHFEGSPATGQDLLEEIREQRLLPLSSIFFMVTGEASYERVVAVVETAPDDYLLKPFTADQLRRRIDLALERKRALMPIYGAIDGGDDRRALEAARIVFAASGRYRLTAARLAAELCLKLKDLAGARRYYQEVLESTAVPWARVGIARIADTEGDGREARRMLTGLIEENDSYVDAYDLLGQMMVEAGELDEALRLFGHARRITPASVTRLQRHGSLAFVLGKTEEAEASLSKALRVGSQSRAVDPRSILQLALLKLDAGEGRSISGLHARMKGLCESAPGDYRLARLTELTACASGIATFRLAGAIEALDRVAAGIGDPAFDVDLASHFLAVLQRLRARDCQLADEDEWVREAGLRFCTSKNVTEYLTLSAGEHFGPRIADAHAEVVRQCDECMLAVLDRRVEEGLRGLQEHAERHRNGRVLALVESICERQQGADARGVAAMRERATELRLAYCSSGGVGASVGELKRAPAA
jgi:DNA-binding response OmpR family regulator